MDTPELHDFDLALPTEPQASGWRSWPPAAKAATGCGTGCALLVLLEGFGVWALLHLAFGGAAPSGFSATARGQSYVAVGQKFALTLTVRNSGTQPLVIQNLVVRPETLKEFAIVDPQRPFVPVPFVGGQMWTANITVPPGQKQTIQFDATPKRAGDLEGEIEVQTGFVPRRVPFSVHVTQSPR